MFHVLIGGISTGLILSLLTGPAFFSLIRTSIENGFKAGIALAIGISTADAIYILFTFVGAQAVEIAKEYKTYMAIIGGFFLIAVGTHYLAKKAVINYDETIPIKKAKQTGYFFKGFLMNLLNPGMFFYWLGVATVLSANDNYTQEEMSIFFSSTLLTVLSIDLTKAYIASKLRHMFSKKVILWMNRIVGTTLIVFAIVIFVKLFFYT